MGSRMDWDALRGTAPSYHPDGSISRRSVRGVEWVSFIRFVGNRAGHVAWTGDKADAATGWDKRAFEAVLRFTTRGA